LEKAKYGANTKTKSGCSVTSNSHRDLDIANLIFETEGSCDLLIKLQKLTLRQFWFYTQIKNGRKLCAKDLILVFDVSRATAYRDIDALVRKSLLCRVGQGKAECYTTL